MEEIDLGKIPEKEQLNALDALLKAKKHLGARVVVDFRPDSQQPSLSDDQLSGESGLPQPKAA
jgi:hypothetical protein